jgi:hypothetical protein
MAFPILQARLQGTPPITLTGRIASFNKIRKTLIEKHYYFPNMKYKAHQRLTASLVFQCFVSTPLCIGRIIRQ